MKAHKLSQEFEAYKVFMASAEIARIKGYCGRAPRQFEIHDFLDDESRHIRWHRGDKTFCLCAKTDLPAAIAEIERLQKELKKLQHEHKKLSEDYAKEII